MSHPDPELKLSFDPLTIEHQDLHDEFERLAQVVEYGDVRATADELSDEE